ncbi:MBL fold metallo-hydrolase [Thermaerobacter litoralis]
MDPKTRTPSEIDAAELKQMLDRGETPFLIDLRNDEEFRRWRIEGRQPLQVIHVPYYEILAEAEEDDLVASAKTYARRHWVDHLPRERRIVVVCAHGGTSGYVAQGLRELGYDAVSLRGGMIAWGDHYEFVRVVEEEDLAVYQINRPARGCLSYLVASEGEAVIIDPLRHAERYLEFARQHGLTITRVLDTHAHADHISSGAELAEQLGVPYHLHPYDAIHPMDVLPATFRYHPVYDGQEFRVGRATLRAIHVPGHTLGQVVYLLDGRYLFSGDTIFVESIARPDLGGRAETWTPLYYRSLLRLMELPDETLVLPGHFSRPQEADARGRVAGRLGDLKQSNEGLKALAAGERAFVDFIMGRLPEFPQQYVDIKRVNTGLLQPSEEQASELELGRNVCALAEDAA